MSSPAQQDLEAIIDKSESDFSGSTSMTAQINTFECGRGTLTFECGRGTLIQCLKHTIIKLRDARTTHKNSLRNEAEKTYTSGARKAELLAAANDLETEQTRIRNNTNTLLGQGKEALRSSIITFVQQRWTIEEDQRFLRPFGGE